MVNMTNRREKRDLVLSMCLGDGCLAYTSNRRSASITIGHGLKQTDYLEFKAGFLAKAFEQNVKVRTQGRGAAVQLALAKKRFKAWRKFIYKNNKKDVSRILPFIINKPRALAFWLMDDGYVESSVSKLSTGEKVNYGARFRIFTCDQTIQTHDYIVDWFYKEFDVTIKIKHQFSKQQNKSYPFIKFSQEDSLKLWSQIRDFVLTLDSMKIKFKYIEQIYQKKLSQRTTT
jgi:hypothetical protein